VSVPPYDIIDRRCNHPSHHGEEKEHVYRMSGRCYNCGASPLVGLFTSGHGASDPGKCPACGCYDVRWSKLADDDPATAL
jgi:hypothetical protein